MEFHLSLLFYHPRLSGPIGWSARAASARHLGAASSWLAMARAGSKAFAQVHLWPMEIRACLAGTPVAPVARTCSASACGGAVYTAQQPAKDTLAGCQLNSFLLLFVFRACWSNLNSSAPRLESGAIPGCGYWWLVMTPE